MKQKGQEGDGGMPLLFVKEDITKMKVDAIVNAANTELRMGSGVCGAIFHAAGEEKMTEACQKLSPIRTGEAVMTDGFALPAGSISTCNWGCAGIIKETSCSLLSILVSIR